MSIAVRFHEKGKSGNTGVATAVLIGSGVGDVRIWGPTDCKFRRYIEKLGQPLKFGIHQQIQTISLHILFIVDDAPIFSTGYLLVEQSNAFRTCSVIPILPGAILKE